jgi:hypothetical protein
MWWIGWALYILAGVVLAERIRRSSEESVRDFWGTDLFGNFCIICVWPIPFLVGAMTALLDDKPRNKPKR